jgi:hypothetical protein
MYQINKLIITLPSMGNVISHKDINCIDCGKSWRKFNGFFNQDTCGSGICRECAKKYTCPTCGFMRDDGETCMVCKK